MPNTGRLRLNLTRLTAGSVLAQIILAAATPLLTRTFAPDAFGLAALFSAAYALLIPLVTLKYDQAVVLPKTPGSAASIGAMVIVIATVNCIVVGLGLLAWMHFSQERHGAALLVLPVTLWLGAAYTLMQQWSSRVSNYTHFARSQVIGAIVNVGTCVGAALFFTAQPVFMVLGITAGIGAALIYTLRGFGYWPYTIQTLQSRNIKRQFKAYGHFPALVLPTALVTIAGANGIPFILSQHYSLDEVGIFAVANRVLLIPAGIVGGALAEAVRSEFAARQRANEPVSPIFKKIFLPIMVLAGVFFGAIFLAPSGAYEFAFGRQYSASGALAQSLLLATFSHFVCAPFMYVFAILRKPARGLLAQVLVTLFPLVALYVFSAQATLLKDALFMYSLFTLGGAATMLTLVYRGCKVFDAKG